MNKKESDFIRVLRYLHENGGESKKINIESVLSHLELKEKRNIIHELAIHKLIYSDGGDYGAPSITFMIDGKHFGSSTKQYYGYNPIRAQLRLDGIKYIQELDREQMNPKNHIHINTGNQSPVQIAIDSVSVSQHNQSKVEDITRQIIDTLFDDNSIDKSLKREAIKTFELVQEESKKGSLAKEILEKALYYGDQISSIGAFVATLVQMLR